MTTSEARKSLALKLKNGRKARRISASKLAKLMHVPVATIEAIESGDESALPLANLTGLTKKYITQVDMDATEIVEEMAALKPLPQRKTSKNVVVPGSRIFVASKATYGLLAVIVLLIILSYAGWQAWQLAAAPRLTLSSPTEDFVTNDPAVVVEGKTSPESSVLVNGSNVGVADDGTFKTTVYMQYGQNFLQVRALNAFGTEAVEDRIIYYRR